MDLKTFLILSGMLGVGYLSYNFIGNKTSISALSKEQTRRISQEIKHQVMIVCIPYSQALKKIRDENRQKLEKSGEAALLQFRGELSTIYTQKQNLILRKFSVTKETYGASLEKHKSDPMVKKNVEEIFNMLERALQGLPPNFEVNPAAKLAFSKEQLCNIYRDLVAHIGKLVAGKLREQCLKNANFDPANDDDFRKAVRQLSIYDVKVQFLTNIGFKPEWGCPNEVFFKRLEDEKTQNAEYNKKVLVFEKTYEKIIEVVSADPSSMDDYKVDKMFADAQREYNNPAPVKSNPSPLAMGNLGNSFQQQQQAPVMSRVQPPQNIQAPVAQESAYDEDKMMEQLMMQELMKRSQEDSQKVNEKVEEVVEDIGQIKQEVQQVFEQKAAQAVEAVSEQGEQAQEHLQQGVEAVAEQVQKVAEAISDEQKLIEPSPQQLGAVASEQPLEQTEEVEISKSEEISAEQSAEVAVSDSVQKSEEHPAEQQAEIAVQNSVALEEGENQQQENPQEENAGEPAPQTESQDE